ncbi:MAG TPA: hypothetical protein VLW17_06915 [Thermoanaerobaculaceae bacterium]|nr:hypothetical protein [Thermoanaerobaculaceae bacterium]
MEHADERSIPIPRRRRRPALHWGEMAWLGLAIVVAGLAAYRAQLALSMYFAGSGDQPAGDLLRRWDEVRRWFAGQTVYGVLPDAIYPPASYLLLWPLVGWLPAAGARLLFGGLELAGLAWLGVELLRLGRVAGARDRGLLAVSLVAFQATAYAVAFGQLVLVLLPLLLWAAIAAGARPRRASRTALVTIAAITALVKPTVAAPFVWLIVLAVGLPWAAAAVAGAYASLTLIAARFQPAGPSALALQWLDAAQRRTTTIGEANVHTWARQLGAPGLGVAASIAVLAWFCAWSFRHRADDRLFLAAVAALVARLWAYHLSYDDLLLLVPMAWIHRTATASAAAGKPSRWARLGLGYCWLVLLAPGAFALFPLTAETILEAARDVMVAVLAAMLFALRDRARGTDEPTRVFAARDDGGAERT